MREEGRLTKLQLKKKPFRNSKPKEKTKPFMYVQTTT
jgi:hypothetical protein